MIWFGSKNGKGRSTVPASILVERQPCQPLLSGARAFCVSSSGSAFGRTPTIVKFPFRAVIVLFERLSLFFRMFFSLFCCPNTGAFFYNLMVCSNPSKITSIVALSVLYAPCLPIFTRAPLTPRIARIVKSIFSGTTFSAWLHRASTKARFFGSAAGATSWCRSFQERPYPRWRTQYSTFPAQVGGD